MKLLCKEEIKHCIKMTSRSNYRVKVDLSKYYQDVRQFSWIYVDSTNVWFISHVKQHIADIFSIPEPFHLLLNGKEYLPPSEDVRVLKENELIAVVPGPVISNANTWKIPSPGMQRAIVKHAVQCSSESNDNDNKDNAKTRNDDVPQNESETVDNSMADVGAIDATMYHSVREVTEMEATPDSKMTDDNIIDDCSTIGPYGIPMHKRKRIRRKRSKNVANTASRVEEIHNEPQAVYDKTKTRQLPVLPTGKHIHFNNEENKEPTVVEEVANDPAVENGKAKPIVKNLPSFKNSNTDNLSTLLALRQCSTPLTFVNKKAKYTSENNFEESAKKNLKMESCDMRKDVRTTLNGQTNGNNDATKMTEVPRDYSQIDPEKYPILEDLAELNDVVAFKILKMGNEYTPEVSDYIVAKTIGRCTEKRLYTFEILRGHAQIQTPLGKFSLPEDETEARMCDTTNVNFSDLIDPRLIYRK